ncbi:MAG: hypothetical protein Q7J54_03895 [Candidatus Woesearchaeota archaeon]|nr:hypothetical protein [Candidatus Woesearchaeota archaeon]
MEQYEEAIQKAKKNIAVADHMISVTYTLLKDPRLLLSIVDNVFLALTYSMSALLYYERFYKAIPAFNDTFGPKFMLFTERMQKYGISKDYTAMIREVKDIIVSHKKSPVEFIRKDRFVICSDNYRMNTISLDSIKKYVTKTKLFIQVIDTILKKNEDERIPRIFS